MDKETGSSNVDIKNLEADLIESWIGDGSTAEDVVKFF